MKYIDAEKLIHDLEERIFAYSEGYAEGDDCRKDAIETLLKDVRYQCSLQQEQQEMDLEEEVRIYCGSSFRFNYDEFNDNFYSNAFEFDDVVELARHFYELGKVLNARKEE